MNMEMLEYEQMCMKQTKIQRETIYKGPENTCLKY